MARDVQLESQERRGEEKRQGEKSMHKKKEGCEVSEDEEREMADDQSWPQRKEGQAVGSLKRQEAKKS